MVYDYCVIGGGIVGLAAAMKLLEIQPERYERFQPGRFDRRRLNRRLKQYAQGDEGWLWQ